MLLQAIVSRQDLQGLVEEELRRRGVQPRGAVRFVGHELDSAVCEVEVTPPMTAEGIARFLGLPNTNQAQPINVPDGLLRPDPIAPVCPTPEAVVARQKRKRRA